MNFSQKLAEKLADYPELEEKVAKLLAMLEGESESIDRAREAEEEAVKELDDMEDKLFADRENHNEN